MIIGKFGRTELEAMSHSKGELRQHIREAVALGEIDSTQLTGRDISNLNREQCIMVLLGLHSCKAMYTSYGAPSDEDVANKAADAAASVAAGPAAPVAPAADVANAVQTMVDAIIAQQGTGAIDADKVIDIAKTLTEPISIKVDDMVADVATIKTLADALAKDSRLARRAAVVAAGATKNPVLDLLTPVYNPGRPVGTRRLLCAPPGIGKSHAIKMLGKCYDLYLEHPCSEDLDEVTTLIGGPVAAGAAGFVPVDGVLTQAMRAAGGTDPQTVLLNLEEVLRWSPKVQEWLLAFLEPRITPAGDVYVLRTRNADASGNFEVLECAAENLHIIGSTNLGRRAPVAAFWDRWQPVDIEYTPALVETVAGSILADHGIAANGLPKVFAKVVDMGRKTAAAGTMAYAVSMRAIKTAAIEAADNTAASVAEHLATLIGPRVRLWDADTGDRLTDGDSALKGMVKELTEYAKKAKAEPTPPPSVEPVE